MHLMYTKLWKFSIKKSENFKCKKKTLFMSISTLLWILAGAVLYGLSAITPLVGFSVVHMFIVAGYFGIIMGYWGSAMFILRNTEPEELE